MVNGIVHVLGSDKAAIENAIAQTRSAAAPLTLPVTMAVADGKVTVNVPAAKDEHRSGEVWLCPITGKVPVAIGRGENHGTHADLSQRRAPLGEARRLERQGGKPSRVPVADLPDGDYSLKDIDQLAVIVQSGVAAKPGLMLGAATASAALIQRHLVSRIKKSGRRQAGPKA